MNTAVFLGRNLAVGGAERVFLNYVNNARRVAPVVALLERNGGLLGELGADVPCFTRVDRTGLEPRGNTLENPIASAVRLGLECRWLRDVVRETRAGVVSSFLMRSHIVALATRMTLMPRLPLVLNIHEHMSGSARIFYPRGYDRALMRWITRHLFPRADRIVVVAEDLKQDLVTTFGVPETMIDVVHNPLDVGRIRAAASEPLESTGSGRRMIVGVGRLAFRKGFDVLLKAVAELRATHDVGLTIVGDGELRQELEELATRLGIESVVAFVGARENPWQYVARADVFALASRTEAFPCVLTEAMALGVPVLSTDSSGGVRECLLDGGCGLIVPTEDVGAIARGLERLLDDADLRARLVAAGRARAESFDLPVTQQRYESVLAGVMASRSV